jgi:anaphase-promoting complex subunit 7
MCVVCPVHTLQVKYKIGLCHLAVHDTRSALSEVLLYSNPLIEGIPSKAKTLRINMTLAKLYRMTGYDRAATAAYKECLRQCPYVLEAIVALAELGTTPKEIHSLFPQVYINQQMQAGLC